VIKLYRYLPGWTVPCISPYVTKVAYYMTMAGLKYEPVAADLTRLDRDTPAGKLPVIEDLDGTKVNDSTEIIDYLQKKYPSALVEGTGAAERAQMHAFNRLIDEHLYWCAVIQPRWRETPNWEIYLRVIAGGDEVPPGLRTFTDDFRFRIVNEFMHGGWGRLPAEAIYRRARADVDALSDFLGSKPFFMGEQPRWVDASVLSILRHTIETPFKFDTKDYAAGKKNLVAYMGRMKDRFGI
jgi:isoprene-epoxide---glutathione S-transferase